MVKGQSVAHSLSSSSLTKTKKRTVNKTADTPETSTPATTNKVNQPQAATTSKNQFKKAESCQTCGTVITKEIRALQCDNCQDTDSWKCADCLNLTHEVYDRCTDTSDPGHFGPKTVRHYVFGIEMSYSFSAGAEVSLGHFGTSADCRSVSGRSAARFCSCIASPPHVTSAPSIVIFILLLKTFLYIRNVAPCLSDAPANGSISGFSSGRVTTVRSLEFVAPIEADVSGVRSNATGYCLYAWCGCE